MADAYGSGGRARERRSHIGGHKRSAAAEDRVHPICYPESGPGAVARARFARNPLQQTRVGGLARTTQFDSTFIEIGMDQLRDHHVEGARRPRRRCDGQAEETRSNEDLARRLAEECRRTMIMLPATTTVERLCADTLVYAERRNEERIASRLASQVVDAVSARLEGGGGSHVTVGGQRLGQSGAHPSGQEAALEALMGLDDAMRDPWDGGEPTARSMTGRELLSRKLVPPRLAGRGWRPVVLRLGTRHARELRRRHGRREDGRRRDDRNARRGR